MEQKFIRAFGHVFVQNSYPKGFQFKIVRKEVTTCTIFFSKGVIESRDAQTGEIDPRPSAGVMIYKNNYMFQEHNCCAIEPTVVYCYDESLNNNVELNLEPVDLLQDQEVVFKNKTKFLLCEGVLRINDNKFTAPFAISIETSDKVVVPETRCLGIKVL